MQHLELLVTLICFVAIKEVMNNFGNPCLIRIMMNLYKKKRENDEQDKNCFTMKITHSFLGVWKITHSQ